MIMGDFDYLKLSPVPVKVSVCFPVAKVTWPCVLMEIRDNGGCITLGAKDLDYVIDKLIEARDQVTKMYSKITEEVCFEYNEDGLEDGEE